MNKRPACPARGWLCCAATGLLLMGPSMMHAQNQSAGDFNDGGAAAQADGASHSTNPLVGTVQRELENLGGKRNPQQARTRKPGLLPFFGPPRHRTPASVEQPLTAPASHIETAGGVPQSSRQFSAGEPRTIQQASGRHPVSSDAKKPGLLDYLLGRDKQYDSQRQAAGQPIAPAASQSTPSGIPGLLPGFLQPPRYEQPLTTGRRQTEVPAGHRAGQPPALNLQKSATPAPKLSDLDNPFPEVTEAEADRKSKTDTPFTGRKLDESQEFEQPVVRSASGVDGFDEVDEFDEVETALEPQATTANAEQPKLTVDSDPSLEFEEETEEPQVESQPSARDDKLKRLANRAAMNGFKGFCPVALRDRRDLVDADPAITSVYDGKIFSFSSAHAKAQFDAAPAKYAPIQSGHDVIVLTEGNVELEGSLENAVWFKDRLYLFSSAATLETFIQDPAKYAEEARQRAGDEDDIAEELEPEAETDEE